MLIYLENCPFSNSVSGALGIISSASTFLFPDFLFLSWFFGGLGGGGQLVNRGGNKEGLRASIQKKNSCLVLTGGRGKSGDRTG